MSSSAAESLAASTRRAPSAKIVDVAEGSAHSSGYRLSHEAFVHHSLYLIGPLPKAYSTWRGYTSRMAPVRERERNACTHPDDGGGARVATSLRYKCGVSGPANRERGKGAHVLLSPVATTARRRRRRTTAYNTRRRSQTISSAYLCRRRARCSRGHQVHAISRSGICVATNRAPATLSGRRTRMRHDL